VESILKTQPGVVDAAVNYANATAAVAYVPEQIKAEDLKKAVQSIGCDLMTEESNTANETLEELYKQKYQQLQKRTLGAILLSVPLVVIGMFFMDINYANYIMWALATPVLLWFGKDFFINAWKQATHRSANMDTLVALSTGVAYTFSVCNTLFPHFWHERGLHAHVYFEAAAVVIAFINASRNPPQIAAKTVDRVFCGLHVSRFGIVIKVHLIDGCHELQSVRCIFESFQSCTNGLFRNTHFCSC